MNAERLPQGSTRERVFRFLAECDAAGDPPTVREIGEAVGLRSPASVHRQLRMLEEAGLISINLTGRSRGWRVTASGGLRGRRRRGAAGRDGEIPIAGRIAAGVPIESLDVEAQTLPISPRAFAASGEVVALCVEGKSMIDAGILPGDYAIIRRQPRVENGEVAAVSIDGEGTLKRWRRKGMRVALEAANRRFPPIPLGRRSLEVRVYGKLIGVVRFAER
ncbi:MAG: transcriptional repressor LexA [Planctomycetota bacterium]